MISRSIKTFVPTSKNIYQNSLLFIIAILISVSVAYFSYSSDAKELLIPTMLIVTLLLAVIAYHYTDTWIPILICLLLVRDFSLGSLIGEGSLKIGDIFIAYVFLIWLIKMHVKNIYSRFIRSEIDLFIILFITIHILSLLWSTDLEYGLLRGIKLVRNIMFYIIIRELFIRDFMRSYKKATAIYIFTGIILMTVHLGVILLFGGFSDFLSFYQKETLTSLDLGALRTRATGGGFLISGPAMWFFIAAILTFGSLTLSKTRVAKLFRILLIILFILGAVLTLQRSLLVMAVIMLLFILAGSMYIKSKRSIIYISIILFAFALMGSGLGFGNIFEKRFANAFEDYSWKHRTEFYMSSIDAFRQSPILGIGAGSNYSWLQTHADIGDDTRVVHSTYLLVLSEVGMTGLGIFLFIIYYWMKYLWDGIKNTHRAATMRNICMALFAFSASYLVYIIQVGEFEEFEVWFVMAIASSIKNMHGYHIEARERIT